MYNPLQLIQEEISKRYSYNRDAPIVQTNNYFVYNGSFTDLGVDVTIKIMINPNQDLMRYLKKLKDSKVENVIKIYQFYQQSEGFFISTQRASYSNLKFSIAKYKKLDDFDTVFMAKILLNIHVDLLRAGINWFGTEQDIQFTQNGIKLSWNNSIPYEQQNPFPLIISKMAGKIDSFESKLLPFPKSRVLQDLIKISSSNASQISLNGNMKKKQKVSKRTGRDWLALKEYKNYFEYYEQIIYFAVHKEHGFVRVKCYNSGEIDKEILALSKTKTTFAKVLQNYNQAGKTYIISQYSNDGTLFNYVNKLKANAIALKQQQIQFFFFSLFQPLKVIQESSIKSLCMLHIKNIYIENGIPKIGEPIPMNKDLVFQLKEKADVPDFYHSEFKKNPKLKSNYFDTYSLGVLMYKLMYTEYPIFPQKKVHIPTTPPYNHRLKTTLQLFLNQGGLLRDLQKKIEISQQVSKQIKLNKKKLIEQKLKSKSGKGRKGINIQQLQQDVQKQQQQKNEQQTEVNLQQRQQNNEQCCRLCCSQLKDPVKQSNIMYDSLQESPYSNYRHCTKLILVVALYVFLFFFFYITDAIQALQSYNKLQKMNVTISTINYQITVDNPNDFYKTFNQTDRSYSALKSIGCFINSPTVDYTSITQKTFFQAYIICSLVVISLIIIYKAVQIYKFDLIKTYYNMSNLISNFNLSNYLLFNFFICSMINNHFIFYNQIFKSTLPICLGVDSSQNYGSTNTFYENSTDFYFIFGGTFIGHLLILTLQFIMLVKTETIRYTRIFNPLLLLFPFLLGYFIVVRIGVINKYFYPSLITDFGTITTYFKTINHVSILGMLPQILFVFELIIEWIVDWFFWFSFDKSRMMMIRDISSGNIVIQS